MGSKRNSAKIIVAAAVAIIPDHDPNSSAITAITPRKRNGRKGLM
jgi:hypothetical protein